MAETSDVFVPKPSLPPPSGAVGATAWVRSRLFDGPLNSLLTLGALWFLAATLIPLLKWAVFDAHFVGDDPQLCRTGGACWLFVDDRLRFFVYGFYPDGQLWRVNVVLGAAVAAIGYLAWPGLPGKRWVVPAAILGLPALTVLFMHGGVFGLPVVPTDQWSGLTLTLVLSFVGIVAALPIGIVLALGRRSKMVAIRTLCIFFIEVWRGVPLISVLFMASVMLPLFLPEGLQFSKVLRAMIGIVLFESAYMAEVVRGGLQAIPRGQSEAAAALGLGYWRTMGLVVLPQALKLVIPGIVNTFIALFKDTTLVLIIGLFDVLATIHATIVDPEWPDIAAEGYIFAALVFWVFCFGMSRYSQALERKLHTGHKRN